MHAVTLSVYIAGHCPASRYSQEMALAIAEAFPELYVEVIDVDQPAARLSGREDILLTPGYFINGRLFSYGNPSWEELERAVRRALAGGD
ncbi:MAG: hypothetical protein ACUVT1_11795 [Anaerolineae bacterium]